MDARVEDEHGVRASNDGAGAGGVSTRNRPYIQGAHDGEEGEGGGQRQASLSGGQAWNPLMTSIVLAVVFGLALVFVYRQMEAQSLFHVEALKKDIEALKKEMESELHAVRLAPGTCILHGANATSPTYGVWEPAAPGKYLRIADESTPPGTTGGSNFVPIRGENLPGCPFGDAGFLRVTGTHTHGHLDNVGAGEPNLNRAPLLCERWPGRDVPLRVEPAFVGVRLLCRVE
jgi:hypothetical protein